MSEEIASADSLLNENAALRANILEWEDAYDRLVGAFELRLAIDECHAAISDYAGGFYDVVIGELATRADQFEGALAVAMNQIDAEHDLTKALLIKMRRYFVSHDLQTGECVAWMHLKQRYHIGNNTEADEQWLLAYEQRKVRPA